jgi:acyl-CoA reductase-like NAD-dependent aldehyde dehydrogenase
MGEAMTTWRNRSPGDLSVELPEVTATPVEPAIAAATRAARDWARTPLAERIAMLQRAQAALAEHREELASGIAIETGKPITEARGEVGAVLAKFDLTLEDAQQHLAPREISGGPHPAWVRTAARGPASVVGPFNFPLHLANGALLAHLAVGNPVIFKPSPLAAVVAARYAELVAPCFPPGVFNLVQGGAAEGQAVCLDPRVRAVCFTGSLPVGRALAQALAGDFAKDLALELGGRNATIVCADADLDLAANAVADAMCLTCGQRCNSTSRILVDVRVGAKFSNLLGQAIEKFIPGDPLREATKLGPLISQSALERFDILVHQFRDWIVPGRVIGNVDGKDGWYVMPGIRHGSTPSDVESFVPLADTESFQDLDEAVARHNESPFGLTASVFTRDEATFRRIADELPVGNIYANLPTTFSPSTLPFGGLGQSGNSHPGGRGFIRFTTVEQALQVARDSFTTPIQ